MKIWLATLLVGVLFSVTTLAKQPQWLKPLVEIYESRLGGVQDCTSQDAHIIKICSSRLRNEGNAPYIYHHGEKTNKTVVLFHGLSDSPYFFRSIAPAIHELGYTVIVALLPGHGLKQADADMEDEQLANRWSDHVDEVIAFAHTISQDVVIGGFSTGGALSALHIIDHPDTVEGLLLFSGALALDESVEDMAGVWGIRTLASLLDGDYKTTGPNPYKYPSVARYAALQLVDVIFEIREKIAKGSKLNLPIFTAHSMADVTTPWKGVESLLAANDGVSTKFQIDKSYDVCHADVVVSKAQLTEMKFDESQLENPEKCSIPRSNPLHNEMLKALSDFLMSHGR